MEAMCSKAGVSFKGLEDGQLGFLDREMHENAWFRTLSSQFRVILGGNEGPLQLKSRESAPLSMNSKSTMVNVV